MNFATEVAVDTFKKLKAAEARVTKIEQDLMTAMARLNKEEFAEYVARTELLNQR